jgi:hypothetical protein
MVEVLKSATFEGWFNSLRDRQAQARIMLASAGFPLAIRATCGLWALE